MDKIIACLAPNSSKRHNYIHPLDPTWMLIIFTGALAEEITMPAGERAEALGHASVLEMHLKRKLPYIQQLRPFGSMVRGTALSRQVNPTVDLDCLICTKVWVTKELFPHVPFDQAEGLLIEEIRSALELAVGLRNLTLQDHWINFNFEGIRFELSVGRRDWEHDTYIMATRDSEWGRAHPKLWKRYGGNSIRGILKDGSDSEEATVAAEPFAINYSMLSEWEQTLATGLVVLLKYWNILYRERIPSFVLERNVVDWLYGARPKGNPCSLFELTCTFLRNRANYDSRLLQKLLSFQALRKAFRAAEKRMACGREMEAVYCLNAVFPWPDRFRHFGPFRGEGLGEVRAQLVELGAGSF